MIFTKFKRFISIILCVIVLFSFSLSCFAKYDIYEYQDINSITESFLTSFLSYCGLTPRLYDYDYLWYEGKDFDKAALRNVVVQFANYLEEKNPALINSILFYASDNGVTSSINPSSYFWTGSLKDNPTLFSNLLSRLVNFLYSYWVKLPTDSSVQSNHGLIPFNMNVTPDGEQYTGCYTWVQFDGFSSLDEWNSSFVSVVKSYLNNDLFLNDPSTIFFFWTYSSFAWSSYYSHLNGAEVRTTFLNQVNEYIYLNGGSPNIPSGPGDSSDSSNDTSSDISSGDSSDNSSSGDSSDSSSVNSFDTIDSYYDQFYRPLFYSILSSYDFNLFSSNFTNTEYVVDCAIDLIWKKIKNHEFSFYSNALTDFKNIAHYEYYNFIDTDIKFYQIDFSSTEFHKRFYFGFRDIFFSVFDVEGDDCYSTSTFLGCKCIDFNGMTLVFSFDTSCDIGQGSRYSSKFDEKFYNFIRTYDGPLLIPFYKNSSMYFEDYTWVHPTYNWTKTFTIFDGYNIITYHENQSSDSIEYWFYDKNALYETWTEWLDKNIESVPIPSDLEQLISNILNTPIEFINHFFLYTSDFFAFLGILWDMIPNEFTIIMLSGFIIIFVTRLFTKGG